MLYQMNFDDLASAISLQESVDGHMPCALPDGRSNVKSRPDHALASLSARQAAAKGLLTSGTFGRCGITSSISFDLTRSLVSRFRVRTAKIGSILYRLTWRQSATRSGWRFYLLRASDRRKQGREFIGWQTPTSRDAKGSSGKGNRIKRGKNGKLHVANLCDQCIDLGRPDLSTSTRFRNWLMGYPEAWEDARVMAMLSSRKSPLSSSNHSLKPKSKK